MKLKEFIKRKRFEKMYLDEIKKEIKLTNENNKALERLGINPFSLKECLMRYTNLFRVLYGLTFEDEFSLKKYIRNFADKDDYISIGGTVKGEYTFPNFNVNVRTTSCDFLKFCVYYTEDKNGNVTVTQYNKPIGFKEIKENVTPNLIEGRGITNDNKTFEVGNSY